MNSENKAKYKRLNQKKRSEILRNRENAAKVLTAENITYSVEQIKDSPTKFWIRGSDCYWYFIPDTGKYYREGSKKYGRGLFNFVEEYNSERSAARVPDAETLGVEISQLVVPYSGAIFSIVNIGDKKYPESLFLSLLAINYLNSRLGGKFNSPMIEHFVYTWTKSVPEAELLGFSQLDPIQTAVHFRDWAFIYGDKKTPRLDHFRI